MKAVVAGLVLLSGGLTAFQAAPALVSGRVLSTTPGEPDITITAGASPSMAAPVSALRRYVDAAGAFSLDVPAGWAARKETGSSEVTLLLGDTPISAAAEPAEPGVANESAQMATLYTQNLRRQCPTAEFSATQSAELAGWKGVGFTNYCAGPRKPTSGQFMFAQADGRVLLFNFEAPTADVPALEPVLTWVLGSLGLGTRPHARSHTREAAARWIFLVKAACRAGVFSQIQCSLRLAEALREQGGRDPDQV